MAKFTESNFDAFRKPASDHEESKLEAAIAQVKRAITNYKGLDGVLLEIFGQGSYANDTNVRLNSDVDVNVMYKKEFYADLPAGMSNNDFGLSDSHILSVTQFKDLVEAALVDRFGRANVVRRNKCIHVLESTTRVACDVVATFMTRRYAKNGSYNEGVELRSDTGQVSRGYPKQHKVNAVEKNTRTSRRFKRATRIMKNLLYRMRDEGFDTGNITSFLMESLMWNVPDNVYNNASSWTEIVKESIRYIWENTREVDTCEEWGEVSELLYLFKGGKWDRQEVNKFMVTLWNYNEFK